MKLKNYMWRIMGVASVFLTVSAMGDVVFSVDKAIPDNVETGLQDTQTISGFAGEIEALTVSLKISAASGYLAYNGDIYATLQHDSGFSVLLNRTGRTALDAMGYGDNGFDVIFTMAGSDIHAYAADSPAYDAEGRLTGTWGADGRNVDPDTVLDSDPVSAVLDNFKGLSANGTWTIFVADMSRNGAAKLDSWGLDLEMIPEPASMALVVMIGVSLLGLRRFASR